MLLHILPAAVAVVGGLLTPGYAQEYKQIVIATGSPFELGLIDEGDRPKVLNCYISLEFSVHEEVRDLRVRFLKKSAFDSPLYLQYIVRHENNDADHSLG